MAPIVGVRVTQANGGMVSFVVIDNNAVVEEINVPAPGESEPRQLSELLGRTDEILRRHAPELLAILLNEPVMGCPKLALHAEGVVLAAAGSRAVTVKPVSGRSLWKPAGLEKKATNAEAANAMCGQLTGDLPSTPTAREAAAAAVLAARLRSA